MANVTAITTARFTLQRSAPSQALAVYLSGMNPFSIANLGYIVTDPTTNLYAAGVTIFGRIIALLGNCIPPTLQVTGIGPSNAAPEASGVVLLDAIYQGYSGIISFAAGEALANDRGEGITFLMSQPIVVGATGQTPQVGLYGINGNVVPTPGQKTQQTASAPNSGATGTGGGGAAGGVGGGGFKGGGGNRF